LEKRLTPRRKDAKKSGLAVSGVGQQRYVVPMIFRFANTLCGLAPLREILGVAILDGWGLFPCGALTKRSDALGIYSPGTNMPTLGGTE
jgi:hypothetical protein